jgi:pimeloyl-ACP methyl ester carboxylesterase/lysophospholipase L1-like esterase
MMDQLGIQAVRPGPSGNENAPNHANYDESKANPFPDLPDALTFRSGQKVASAADWWHRRRPEIVADFEREVLGRVPTNPPKITWTVTSTTDSKTGVFPVLQKQLTGHADNSSCPFINVDIQMTLVTPANARGPVPVMMMFGSAAFLKRMAEMMASRPELKAMIGSDPPSMEQLIAAGWGYALIDPGSVQADNGAGLTKGIIGLANQGRPRKPDDWGALRAWAWGASRGLDYLETDKSVDAKRVGIEGVSRFGKAALVTMAFDTRFAVVLVGSSGEGGAKPHKRNFGEAVESLTGSGEYHWMAGNFIKYGASQATFGSKNAGDLPVDSNELIALCAPRLTFISYGIPEKGDAKWLDQQGSFMATVAAGPVFRLLGAWDLGITDDYHTAKMPPVNTGLLDGQLAWRQHDAGHTDAPNWKYFIPWADKFLEYHAAPWDLPADQPVFRTDPNSLVAHAQLLAKAKQGGIDIYFEGDSITRRWGATDYPDLLANWKQNFLGWNAADFGWGADRTQNILWRLENGELDAVNPKVVVLLAGTNNLGNQSADDVTRGLRAIVRVIQEKAPAAAIIVMGILPRNDNMTFMPVIDRINENLSSLADGRKVRYLNINAKLADSDGMLFDGMMNAKDKLHPTAQAYQVWADALKPVLTELLGPPVAADHAPPPTGDPSAIPTPVVAPAPAAADGPSGARHYVEVRGAKLYTQIYGHGAPIVFLHGGMAFFDNSFAKQRDYFATYRTVVGIDQRGYGHSPDGPWSLSYQMMADDTAAVIAQLGLGPVDVVGHSDGANLALILARDHPQMVRRLVISGANLRANLSPEEKQRAQWSPQQLSTHLREVANSLPPWFLADYSRVSPDGPGHWMTLLAKSYDMWLQPVVIAPADLKRISIPVLVMAGDHDFTSVEENAEIFRGLPNGQLIIVPASNHGTFSKRPGLVNLAIREFLEQPDISPQSH